MSANARTGDAATAAGTLARHANAGKRGDHDGRSSRRRSNSGMLRFPCGHVEAPDGVASRVRETARAAWIACRQCNAIAVVWR